MQKRPSGGIIEAPLQELNAAEPELELKKGSSVHEMV